MAQLCPIEPTEEIEEQADEEAFTKIDQGVRLAKLQFLLKREELLSESGTFRNVICVNSKEDRTLNPEVARQVHSAYIELCTILHEVRNLEKLIEAVSSGRIGGKVKFPLEFKL